MTSSTIYSSVESILSGKILEIFIPPFIAYSKLTF